MKKFLQIATIITLVIWGFMFLYFYSSGRIEKYLDPSFRLYALIAGVVMVLLALFNFLHRKDDTGTCTHDHVHGEACDHDHHHRAAAVDGEHHSDHDHSHDHDHHHRHDHSHSEHDDDSVAHDHAHDNHDHDHDHGHGEDHPHSGHHHEETNSGLAFALIVLLAPALMAAAYSPDKFSGEYLAKWGKIERQMMQMRIAKQREAEASSLAKGSTGENPYTRDAIERAESDDPNAPSALVDGEEAAVSAESEAADQTWGTFTIEDLKQMVPQNTDGEFLLDVPQIFYTAGDKELMDVMEGIPVETTAQLMEETMHNEEGNRLKAFRLFIECCAADARPLSIPVEFPDAIPDYTEMGWYNLYGDLHYSEEMDGIMPILKIQRIEKTSEPMDGLLY